MTQPRLPWEDPSNPPPQNAEQECAELDSPVVAPPTLPPPPADPAVAATVGDIQDALQTGVAVAVAKAQEIAQAEIKAHLENKPIVLSTTNATGQKLKLADAKNRAIRTLLQNLGVDVLVALGTVLPMLVTMDFTDKAAWGVFGISVAKTVVNVFVSYVSRLTADPVIPTPVETSPGTVVQPLPGSNAEG